jgi:hypothetical protein
MTATSSTRNRSVTPGQASWESSFTKKMNIIRQRFFIAVAVASWLPAVSGAEELWREDRITPEQPFRAKVVAVQPGWGWDTIILEEIDGAGRYCLATFGNPLGDYTIVERKQFDEKAMKQKGAIFLDPPVEVARFSWSMSVWRHGRIFGDEDTATKHRKKTGERNGTGNPSARPQSRPEDSQNPQPESKGRSR